MTTTIHVHHGHDNSYQSETTEDTGDLLCWQKKFISKYTGKKY